MGAEHSTLFEIIVWFMIFIFSTNPVSKSSKKICISKWCFKNRNQYYLTRTSLHLRCWRILRNLKFEKVWKKSSEKYYFRERLSISRAAITWLDILGGSYGLRNESESIYSFVYISDTNWYQLAPVPADLQKRRCYEISNLEIENFAP